MSTPKDMMVELAKLAGFKHTDPDACIAQGICIVCGNKIEDRISTLAGRREYLISAFCEVCFDEAFKED